MARRAEDVRVVARAAGPERRWPVGWLALVAAMLVVGLALGRATAGGGAQPCPPRAGDGGTFAAHSSDGAVAALLSYSATLDDPHVLLNASRRAQVLAQIATPRYAAAFS